MKDLYYYIWGLGKEYVRLDYDSIDKLEPPMYKSINCIGLFDNVNQLAVL